MKKQILSTVFVATAAALSIQTFAAGPARSESPQKSELLKKYELKSSQGTHFPKSLGKAKEIKKASIDLYTGRVADAAMIYSNAWENLSISEVPYGLYKLDIGALTSTPVKTDAFYYNFMSGTYTPDEFIGLRVMSAMGVFTGVNIISIDPVSKSENWSVTYGDQEADMSYVSSVMAYNPVDGNIYSVNYNSELTGLTINVFNKQARMFVPYIDWTARVQPLTMAFTPTGECHAVCSDGALYRLDIKTGNMENIGDTGIKVALYTQSMSFDGVTGNYIWAAITERGSKLLALDPESAEVEEVATFGNNEQFAAISMPFNTSFYGAPSAVSSIDWNSYSGECSGNVSFTLPGTLYGGSAYQGELTYTLWIDGTPVAENVKSNAGQWISIPQELSNDLHFFAVSTANNVGRSPVTSARHWAGFDYPVAPASAAISVEEQNFKIVWEPVTTGRNGGYIDTQNLSYKVFRMPDNVCVASDLKETTFTDPIPTEMKRYYYEVAAVNGDGKAGDRCASNIILQGSAASVPYSEDFGNDSFLSLYRLVDNDGNGTNWTYADWNQEIDANTFSGTEDNWLIMPPVKFEADSKYQLVMNMRTAWEGYPETIKIMLGKENMELADFTEIYELKDFEILDFEDVPVDFSVPEDGDYELAIVACSRGTACSTIRISSLKIDELGKLSAPAEVTDLTIVPDAADALAATVCFTIPQVTLDNSPLTSVTKVDILVDDVQAASVTDVTPGQEVSKLVENIPSVGKHKFTVRPANEAGYGKPVSTYSFIGCYSAPWSETFDTQSSIEFWSDEYSFPIDGIIRPLAYDSYNQAIKMDYFASAAGHEMWMFSPDFKLDSESVYTYTFDYQNQYYEGTPMQLTIGNSAQSSSQTALMELPVDSYYKKVPVTAEIVTDNAGKYNIGINAVSGKEYDYVSFMIDNAELKYLTSAKAPYSVTDFAAVADKSGRLEADLSFNAPAVDFAGRAITKIDKIEILRGDNVIPVATLESPAPGSPLTWHDNAANYGKNVYSIVAYNEAGRGKFLSYELFVGEDIPAIENVKITSTPDNMSAVLSWDKCEFGVNGGVMLDEDLTYTVFSYDAETQQTNIIEEGLKDTSYNFAPVDDDQQAYYYYGVIPVNNIGEGEIAIKNIVLGQLYTLPFTETFPAGVPTNELWSIYSQNPYIAWQPMNEFWEGYADQNGDSGCLGFFNGNMYTNYAGDRLYTPKVSPSNYLDPTLSFWVLHVRKEGNDYTYPALLRVNVSTDDEEFVQVSNDEDMESDGTNPQWKKYEFDFSDYHSANNLRFAIDAYTNGGNEVIYLDNVSIYGKTSGIDDIESGKAITVSGGKGVVFVANAAGNPVNVFTLAGIKTAYVADATDVAIPMQSGIYVVSVGSHTYKVVVK